MEFVSRPKAASSITIGAYVTNPRVDAEEQTISRAALSEAPQVVLTNCILDALYVPCTCYGRKEFCYTKAVLFYAHRLLVTELLVAHFCCFDDEDSALDFVSRRWVIKNSYVLPDNANDLKPFLKCCDGTGQRVLRLGLRKQANGAEH